MVILKLHHAGMGPPIVAPARSNALCPWCGRRFPVPAKALELISAIAGKAGLKSETYSSACGELPADFRRKVERVYAE